MRWLATAVEEAVVDGVADEAVAAAVEVVAVSNDLICILSHLSKASFANFC